MLKFSLFIFFTGMTIINYSTIAMFDKPIDESLNTYQVKRIYFNNKKFSVSEKIKESDNGKKYIKIKRNFTMTILKQNRIDLFRLRDDYIINLKYNMSQKAWIFCGLMEDTLGTKDCLAIKIAEDLNILY